MAKQAVKSGKVDNSGPGYVTSAGLSYGKKRKLHVGSFGGPRSGKTRLLASAVQAAGMRLGMITLDRNSIPTCIKMEEENPLDVKGMIVYPVKPLFPVADAKAALRAQMVATRAAKKKEGDRSAQEKEAIQLVKRVYKDVVDRVVDQVMVYAGDDEIGIVGIDTGEQLYTFMQLSDFGKLESNIQRNRGALNQDFKNIIKLCEDKHLIVTHPSKPEYKKRPGQEDGEATGREIMDGWPQIGYNMSVLVEHVKIEDVATRSHYCADMDVKPGDVEIPTWLIRPYSSQVNPWLNRKTWGHCLVNEECTFMDLGAVVFGAVDVDEGTVERNYGWLEEDE